MYFRKFVIIFHWICLFCLYLKFIVPLENFSLIWRRHHCRRRAANFDLCSALMTIEQWGFFSVPHLLWHGASVYNGNLSKDPWHSHLLLIVWLWSCHYLFLRLRSVAAGIRTPQLSACDNGDIFRHLNEILPSGSLNNIQSITQELNFYLQHSLF